MTKNEQLYFVDELVDNIRDDVKSKIDAGVIPENWDGIKLRQFLADRFAESGDAALASLQIPTERRRVVQLTPPTK